MKKKVFFVVSSLGVGGSERVFWLLSQNFNKEIFDVYIVLFDSRNDTLSKSLKDITVIDLKTINASKSFFKLYRLIKDEKPYAVFSTATHVNILVALVSFFAKVPHLIGRESNIYNQMSEFGGLRAKFWGLFVNFFYKKFNVIVCQSVEMKNSFQNNFIIDNNKLVVIHNPVLKPREVAPPTHNGINKIVMLGRLAAEKGHDRLLKIFAGLPNTFFLTIAGNGPLKKDIEDDVYRLRIQNRIFMPGHITDVNQLLSQHKLFVLTSYTEGFPNAVLEALAVGIPVVAFSVGGITELIKPGFNGYIIDQGDLDGFRSAIVKACNQVWDTEAIKQDIDQRFSVNKIAEQYEALIS